MLAQRLGNVVVTQSCQGRVTDVRKEALRVDPDDAEPTVGRTRARFGGASRRRKAKRGGAGGQPASELGAEAPAAVPDARWREGPTTRR
jgi:hypothetical protein